MPGLLLLILLTLAGPPNSPGWESPAEGLRVMARFAVQPYTRCPRWLLQTPDRSVKLVPWLLPYCDWDEEYRKYFEMHYHTRDLTFAPTVIVMHYTVGTTSEGVRDGFMRGTRMCAGDAGTVFGHPSVQLMVDPTGKIYQLMPLDRRATGSYGVDQVALSIEMVALSERDLLSRPHQVLASFQLVRSLCRQFHIPPSKVYGHYEVSIGKLFVPEYTDFSDSRWPWCYPLKSARNDPGPQYLRWLHQYLNLHAPRQAGGRA